MPAVMTLVLQSAEGALVALGPGDGAEVVVAPLGSVPAASAPALERQEAWDNAARERILRGGAGRVCAGGWGGGGLGTLAQ